MGTDISTNVVNLGDGGGDIFGDFLLGVSGCRRLSSVVEIVPSELPRSPAKTLEAVQDMNEEEEPTSRRSAATTLGRRATGRA
jgi:hypothetical protein